MSRFGPYAIAAGGVAAITFAIAVVASSSNIPGLSAVYLLLVLWLAARWGRGPAVVASIAAFLLYDFFLVPPVGTFAVNAPSQVFELVVLLAVALVTSQLAASIRRAQAESELLAADSRALYELATVALRMPQLTVALSMVCDRARTLASVARFALVAVDSGKEATVLAGDELTPDDVHQASWAYENKRSVGITVTDGVVKLMKTHPEAATPAYLPLASAGRGNPHAVRPAGTP